MYANRASRQGCGPCQRMGRAKHFDWCWGCYLNKRGKAQLRGHHYYQAPRVAPRYRGGDNVKKPDDTTGPAKGPEDFPDPDWVKKYPRLCEYLACEIYEDGQARTPSTLGVKAQDGRVLLTINDKDLRRSLYLSGETFLQAMQALERCLGVGTGDWRSWGGSDRKKK